MTQIVDPSKIESQLINIWEHLAKEKMRACLFNLIVFNRLSPRTDYIRTIVQNVSEKYPCRVLFITSDPDAPKPYLKTAVSVVGATNIACDYIDIGASGPNIDQVPNLILPHLVPDLPISLLWTEDPTKSHSLFEPLSKLANRIIFDSESADNLLDFAKKVLSLNIDIADLNWARTVGWRDLLASTFDSVEKIASLKEISHIKINYNSRETESFCHTKIQSMYLLSWLANRLHWKFKSATKDLMFQFENQTAEITSEKWDKLGSGTIISVDIISKDGHTYNCARIPNNYHRVSIEIASSEKCELPYQFLLGQTASGHSLVREIITKGTSHHYIDMLKELNQIDQDQLC